MKRVLLFTSLLAAPATAAVDPLQLPVRSVAAPAAAPIAPPATLQQPQAERPPIPPPLIESTARQIEAQSRGDYGAMDRLTQLPSSVLPTGSINRQFDHPNAARGQVQPFVVRFSWDPMLVMQLRTPVNLGTRIYLPDWERVQEPIWNTKPWSFEVAKIAPSKLMVIGHAAGDDTMVTVVGSSGNTYTFYVRAEGFNANTTPDAIAVVEASSPGPTPGSSLTPSNFAPSIKGAPPAAEPLDFPYRWYVKQDSDRDIAPDRVFRLGPYTYFDFGTRAATMTKPAIYAVVDGVETLANVETKGENGQLMRVDVVESDFALKSGDRTVCVKYERAPRAPAPQEAQRGTLAALFKW
ncbi:TrbG/VirB9 family P-type conjugative transfer protein [Roseiterribacter gracilis]